MFPWTTNANIDPMVIRDAEGVYIIDDSGRQILDFSAQLKCVNAGHKNKRIIKAIQVQAEKLCYVSPGFAQEPRTRLAKMMAEVVPGDLNKFFFANGGAEANENVIKMARAFTQKQKIITLYRSYHGATLGALGYGGHPFRRSVYMPLYQNVPHIPAAYCYRCDFGATYPDCGLLCAWALEKEVRRQGPENIAAFIAEPVAGAALGAVAPVDEYFAIIREICDRYDVVFIADEVMTGFGRTGEMFGMQNWDVKPDMMACAKGISGGYVPLGAVIMDEKIIEAMKSATILGQDFLDEVIFTNNRNNDDLLHKQEMSQYQKFYDYKTVLATINRNGIFPNRYKLWFDIIGAHDFVIGARLHGCIAALIQGVPAVLVPRDLRMMELADFYNIPTASIEDIQKKSIEQIFDEIDFSNFKKTHKDRYKNYYAFLEKNKLVHKLNSPTLYNDDSVEVSLEEGSLKEVSLKLTFNFS